MLLVSPFVNFHLHISNNFFFKKKPKKNRPIVFLHITPTIMRKYHRATTMSYQTEEQHLEKPQNLSQLYPTVAPPPQILLTYLRFQTS